LAISAEPQSAQRGEGRNQTKSMATSTRKSTEFEIAKNPNQIFTFRVFTRESVAKNMVRVDM